MWQVETAVGNGWENVWQNGDGTIQLFDTKWQAEAELEEFLSDQADAVADGFMGDVYDPDDFRITEVQDEN